MEGCLDTGPLWREHQEHASGAASALLQFSHVTLLLVVAWLWRRKRRLYAALVHLTLTTLMSLNYHACYSYSFCLTCPLLAHQLDLFFSQLAVTAIVLVLVFPPELAPPELRITGLAVAAALRAWEQLVAVNAPGWPAEQGDTRVALLFTLGLSVVPLLTITDRYDWNLVRFGWSVALGVAAIWFFTDDWLDRQLGTEAGHIAWHALVGLGGFLALKSVRILSDRAWRLARPWRQRGAAERARRLLSPAPSHWAWARWTR